MLRLPRLAVLVGLTLATATAAAPAAPFAYITNSGGYSVTVVDVATNTVSGAPIPVPGIPGGVVVNADATRVYVSSWGAPAPYPNLVSVIDTASRTVVAQIPLPSMFPAGLALTPDGARLFVTHSVASGPTLVAIETATNTVVAQLSAGRVNAGIVVHPNGTKLYIATLDNVLVYDPLTLAFRGSIAVGARPYGLAMNPAGTRLYVANYGESSVSVVDTATDLAIGAVSTGRAPFALSVSPDGTRLFVGNQVDKTLSIIDTASLTTLAEVPLSTAQPYGVQSGPGGDAVYVADFANSKLLVVDAINGVVASQIAVGNLPIAFGEFLRSTVVPTVLGPGGVTPGEVMLGSSTPVSLSAVLTRQTGGAVSGATVEFRVDGAAAGSGMTASDGVATFMFTPAALSAGPHAVRARFGGGTVGGVTYGASSGDIGTLQVKYGFVGFLPPLNGGVNRRGASSMVPVKWRLANAAGSPIGDLSAVAGIYVGTMPCGEPPSAWTAATGALTYESGEFVFMWKTDRIWNGKCARLSVALVDGTAHTAEFSFR
jgi:YVTN family beta-propeller protein